MKNIFTVDLEDWYQGIEIKQSQWQSFEKRLEKSSQRLLDLLEQNDIKATFFVLGKVAEEYPGLIKYIYEKGHEISTHGYSHQFIYKLKPEEFQAELNKSIRIIFGITGSPVAGHRAAFFSITKDSLWAFDILAEAGIEYDSSVFPVVNYRYGISDAPVKPYKIKLAGGKTITELPITTVKFLRNNMPFSGGAYFRLLPYGLIKGGIKKVNKEGYPAIFYIHPWELDPGHPKLKLPARISFTHYYNLKGCEEKLKRLLADFEFTTMKDAVRTLKDID